ncbi:MULTISPECIES: M10 family metallopeptidase C-terminal domain-containing protein [unclassified Colwellia]|uniref:M10 family metallopeptidase C-terminal domain-containing protein n=1 Tax=unclassified Colwellia TaxID=196834 RepID=UPI0015F56B5B|nr:MULTISPECIES: M10 family metallopeptidase C-terminal domain-containing protein [unclassified Colwellia]MBA6356639.1 M10 family metallopeptidase C-terminal domain-containing protein [Colwellia sp. BRX8-3]MBA6360947.1 M10 family metallopeptidase C-terminal domain-containing protein [Colwellia sp. BRX8-6]MBA6368387.1 M10 family metallopeptidase C-terminal domain-containing protein [Colwellia sp. BRX8-5]MBA6375413.1 M10 family metallopeptidase C-terminal domain-containing protein [Colwellia sp. 
MLTKFVRSALSISFFTATLAMATFASASDLVDFNTTHVFPTDNFDLQRAVEGLRHAPYDYWTDIRWNEKSPLGTPITIKFAFSGKTIGGRDVRDFYPREKELIIGALTSISRVSGISFVEDDPIDRTERYDLLFENIAGDISFSGLPSGHSSPINSDDCDNGGTDCEIGARLIDLSVNGLLDYLNPQREFDEANWVVDYKHDLSKAKSELLYHILQSLGVYPSDHAGVNVKLTSEYDNKFYTLMSSNIGNSSSEVFYPTDLKKYDVAVLQHLYGKAENTNTGDTLYTYDDSYDFHQIIYDVDGVDTLSVADTARNNIIDLRAGAFSSIAPNPTGFYDKNIGGEHLNRSNNNLSISYDVVIENAIGGKGDDVLVANSVANMLDGGGGIDIAKFAGNKADYTIEIINAYTVEVTSVVVTEDKDSLVDFEFIQFADETIVINKAPVVTMPETITVREGLQANIAVTVTQPDNDIHSYTWTQLDGIELTLENADNLNVNFVAPSVDAQETINLQLVVSDGANVITNTVTIIVVPNNTPIITNVTADQTVDERTTVILTVTATDADNDALTYRWVVNDATVILTGDTTETVSFTAPDVTTSTNLTVQVFVTDGFDEVSSEIRTVTVNNIDTTPDPVVTPAKEKSSGGSFGYLILLIAGLRLFRK